MNDQVMLNGAEPRRILQVLTEKRQPAIMSYLSRGKWHIAKVLLNNYGANSFAAEVSPRKNPHPMNIYVDQQVGISVKYGYGKLVFDTKVINFQPSSDHTKGGMIVLAVPERIELVQRRNYFRVNVPEGLRVNVAMWHRSYKNQSQMSSPSNYLEGKLVDISAGGAQVAINSSLKADFRKGQFVGVKFTPLPYEEPLVFAAQVRNLLPSADNKSVCFGLQMVGLEASPEGRTVLFRLVKIAERYYNINLSGAKQQDMQMICT